METSGNRMHTLARQVRFQIDPFGKQDFAGVNSYAARPFTDGLGVYVSLWITLQAKVNERTGFVVNVSEIDLAVRQYVVPQWQKWVRDSAAGFKALLSINDLYKLLDFSRLLIDGSLDCGCRRPVKRLDLELNPYRKMAIRFGKKKEDKMLTYSEKFEFAAMHKLWNENYSDQENFQMFGKCANPAGHGHNYILEVTVCPPPRESGWILSFERIVKEKFVDIVDHKNLNIDVKEFKDTNPTVENIVRFAWKCLKKDLNDFILVEITVWENDRTYCRYSES